MTFAELLAYIIAIGLVPTAFLIGNRYYGVRGGFVAAFTVGVHLMVASFDLAGFFYEAGGDNLDFHYEAEDYAFGVRILEDLAPRSNNWPYAFSVIYAAVGSSMFLGYMVNQIFFLLLCQQLLAASRDWFPGNRSPNFLILFGILPSGLLFANFLLRESFQALCLVFALRCLEHYRQTGSLGSYAKSLIGLIPFGLIHNGFFVFIPIALLMPIFSRMVYAEPGGRAKLDALGVFVGALLTLGLVVTVAPNLQDTKRMEQLTSGSLDINEALILTRERGSRTVFPWSVEGLGPLGLPIQFVQFFGAPAFPFMIQSGNDVVAFVEAIIRFLVVFGMIRLFLMADPQLRPRVFHFLLFYFAFMAFAAVGTTTVGTAMRHSFKVVWIPVLLAGYYWFGAKAAAEGSLRRVQDAFAPSSAMRTPGLG